jgi:Fe-S-cluster containining protein
MAEPIISDLFTIWDYDAQTVTRYQREGACNGCGLCCVMVISFRVVSPLDSQNLRQGGVFTSGKGKWAEANVDGRRVFFRMDSYQPGVKACVHLTADKKCSIYQNRYLLCRTWPHSFFDVMHIPECSYRFQILAHHRFDELPIKPLY